MSTTTTLTNTQRTFILVPSLDEDYNFTTLKTFFSSELTLTNLRTAIEKYDNINFYKDLLPSICEWASDHENSSKFIKPLIAEIEDKLEYTSKQVRYILANAFFLNTIQIRNDKRSSTGIDHNSGFGSLDLKNLYETKGSSNVAVARILCFFAYFHQQSVPPVDSSIDRIITIERYCNNSSFDWFTSTAQIESDQIEILTNRMESSTDSNGFVDFANKHIQIHCMIPSCTQEEILFSCCPEAFLSMIICESLRDNEIVILRGCKRYADYTGYQETFRYTGHYSYPTSSSPIQDILIMDAIYHNHYRRNNVQRDMNKAYLAFNNAATPFNSSNYKIVTGHWGCGAFDGNTKHKFLQQVCVAATLPNMKLDYSVYMDQHLAMEFKQLLKKINGKMIKDVMEDEHMIM